ncbi:MAG: hypothetical protein KDD94_13070, partial [Calditrichaeota bacterium]|nr:hypothetical protein [Calditrichota bacterium]
MKNTFVKSLLNRYRRSIISDQLLRYLLLFFAITFVILLSFFLLSRLFIVTEIDNVFRLLIAVNLLILASLFAWQNRSLLFGDYLRSIINSLSGSNASHKNKLYNLYDIERKPEISELESDYFDTQRQRIELVHNRVVDKTLLIGTTVLVFTSLILYSVSSDFSSYTQLLLLGERHSDTFSIEVLSDNLRLMTDSTATISYNSNIPDLSFLNLVIEEGDGRQVRQAINYRRNQFEFKYDYIKSGRFYLEVESTLFGLIRSNSVDFEFIQPLKVISHDVTINYPAYTGRPREIVKNINDITVLKGSLVTWQVTVNKEIESLESNFKRLSDSSFVFNKRLYSQDRFELNMLDADSLALNFSSEPIKINKKKKPVIV